MQGIIVAANPSIGSNFSCCCTLPRTAGAANKLLCLLARQLLDSEPGNDGHCSKALLALKASHLLYRSKSAAALPFKELCLCQYSRYARVLVCSSRVWPPRSSVARKKRK